MFFFMGIFVKLWCNVVMLIGSLLSLVVVLIILGFYFFIKWNNIFYSIFGVKEGEKNCFINVDSFVIDFNN